MIKNVIGISWCSTAVQAQADLLAKNHTSTITSMDSFKLTNKIYELEHKSKLFDNLVQSKVNHMLDRSVKVASARHMNLDDSTLYKGGASSARRLLHRDLLRKRSRPEGNDKCNHQSRPAKLSALMPSVNPNASVHRSQAVNTLLQSENRITHQQFLAHTNLDGHVLQSILAGRNIIWEVPCRNQQYMKTLIVGLLHQIDGKERLNQALILTVSRSSAHLTDGVLSEIAGCIGVNCHKAIGDTPIGDDISSLQYSANVIIGLPGIIEKMITRQSSLKKQRIPAAYDLLFGSHLKTVILQDAEILVEPSFKKSLDKIMKALRADVQVLCLCQRPSSNQLANMTGLMKNPKHIIHGYSNALRKSESLAVAGMQLDAKLVILGAKAVRVCEDNAEPKKQEVLPWTGIVKELVTKEQKALAIPAEIALSNFFQERFKLSTFAQLVHQLRCFIQLQTEPVEKQRHQKHKALATPIATMRSFLQRKFNLSELELNRAIGALGFRKQDKYFLYQLSNDSAWNFFRLKDTAVEAFPNGTLPAENRMS